MPKPNLSYSAQFREQVVDLVRAKRKPSELFEKFGYLTTNILSWARLANRGRGASAAMTASLNANECKELIELCRKLRQIQQERNILAKARIHDLHTRARRRLRTRESNPTRTRVPQ